MCVCCVCVYCVCVCMCVCVCCVLTSARSMPSLKYLERNFRTTDWNCVYVRSRQMRKINGGPNLWKRSLVRLSSFQAHIHPLTHPPTHAHTPTHTHIDMSALTSLICVHPHKRTSAFLCTHACTYAQAHTYSIHMHTHIHMHTYIHTCTHTCTHTHAHIHTHMHTHMYTHTCTHYLLPLFVCPNLFTKTIDSVSLLPEGLDGVFTSGFSPLKGGISNAYICWNSWMDEIGSSS